jgi:hypothetical protein
MTHIRCHIKPPGLRKQARPHTQNTTKEKKKKAKNARYIQRTKNEEETNYIVL